MIQYVETYKALTVLERNWYGEGEIIFYVEEIKMIE